jgi:hypothetical protein
VRGESARNFIVPSGASSVPGLADAGVAPGPGVGRRKTKVLPEATPSDSAGGMVASPSVRAVAWPSGWAWGSAGTLGSASCPAPQETRRSWSPPKPVCRERSAPHADAGSGRLPYWASPGLGAPDAPAGSSSKKCGPVSSTCAGAGSSPVGGASGSPSVGAGRLVPGTQEVPFQYRTYPGMEGSG